MGLLDKLSGIARNAGKVKDALDATGITATGPTSRPSHPDDQRRHDQVAARSEGYRQLAERCVTDPFDLISRSEVTELTGLTVGPAAEWHSDDCVGIEFPLTAGSGTYWLRVDAFPTRSGPTDAPDATTTWQFLSTETAAPRVPIEGLGDQAFLAAGDLVCVLVREQVLVISGALPPGADAAAILTSVARAASARA